jgi:hypothetical protein
MREVTHKVYQYDELNDAAKEQARAWYTDHDHGFEFDYDCVYEDAKRLAGLIGIRIKDISFSGFWSQGDGASFIGSYSWETGGVKALKAEAPNETELHRIAKDLQKIQAKRFYRIRAEITRGHLSNHYSHANTVDIAVFDRPDTDWETDNRDMADDIAELLRDFMQWIYAALEREYDFQVSEEAVSENIRGNDYEFYEDGSFAS